MDVERFLKDYGIHYAGAGERHHREGWVNLPCPFCAGHNGNHLGYSIPSDYWSCHRCGGKSAYKVVQKLLGVPSNQIVEILKKYRGKGTQRGNSQIAVTKVAFRFPDDLMPITKSKLAVNYFLDDRKHFSRMDLAWLEKRYNLQATGDEGLFFYNEKELDLSNRLVAPITQYYDTISWQTRDLTGYSKFKYITCPEAVELVHHKDILYNPPEPWDFPIVALCEGIFDVWKVMLAGYPATCCFGVKYKPAQLKALLEYKKVIVMFDPDKAGKNACRKLRRQLLFAGREIAFIKDMEVDPGDNTKARIGKMLKPLWKLAS